MENRIYLLAISLIAFGLLLPGCDSSGGVEPPSQEEPPPEEEPQTEAEVTPDELGYVFTPRGTRLYVHVINEADSALYESGYVGVYVSVWAETISGDDLYRPSAEERVVFQFDQFAEPGDTSSFRTAEFGDGENEYDHIDWRGDYKCFT